MGKLFDSPSNETESAAVACLFERVSDRVMRNIAEQTAEAATNAKVCLLGNIGE